MAKARRARRRIASRRIRPRSIPYKFPSPKCPLVKKMFAGQCPKVREKKDWEDVICSVCMECPHKAVLLLCSSHDKGCRPYMCGTSFRFSNCLDQYKKASAKLMSSDQEQETCKCELSKITCPLCRGQVKGWTIVESARDFLNLKRRSCMQENCSFVGTYKELRKHMKMEHPSARPREVDPNVEQKWRRLELEREREDVISTIRSTIPGAMVFGDYVIERNPYGSESDDGDDDDNNDDRQRNEGGMDVRDLVNVFLLLHAFGPPGGQSRHSDAAGANFDLMSNTIQDLAPDRNNRTGDDADSNSSGEENDRYSNYDNRGGISSGSRLRRQGGILLVRSGRRRRNSEANDNQSPSR